MKIFIIFCVLFVSFFACAMADFGFELQYSQSFSNNLLLDSSEMNDSYSTTAAKFKYYPISQVEVNLKSDYTYYGDLIGLGNVVSGGGLTVIPISSSSPFSIYLNANYSNRSYRNSFRVYNTNDVDILASIGYKLGKKLQFRTGLSYKNKTYINSDQGDRETYEIFVGGNVTPFGSNSFDFEAGWSFAQSNFLEIGFDTITYFPIVEEIDGDIKSFYFSPRFSRPIGKKIGIALTYTFSEFQEGQDLMVYSYSTGFLSPWASVWDGHSIIFNVKSYLIPSTIMTAGMGYWEKRFLKTLELPDFERKRDDICHKYYLSISRPIPFQSGMVVEPSIQLNITNNNSTNKLFHYSDLLVLVGLTFKM